MEQYIEPFIKGSKEVFKELCNIEINDGRGFFLSKGEFEKNWDISGIIGLSGEANGAVAISLKEITACRITNILTNNEHTSIDSYVTDTIGEIINIIVGNVKVHYEENYRIKITLPTIIKGKSHSFIWPSEKTRIICIPFSIFENQEFFISIVMEQIK